MKLSWSHNISCLLYVIRRLKYDEFQASEWCEFNYMNKNEYRCFFLSSGHNYEVVWSKTGRVSSLGKQRKKGFRGNNPLVRDI